MNNDVHQNQMHSVGFRSTWPIERARVAASACTSRSYCGLKGDDGTVVFDRLLTINLDREGVAHTSACRIAAAAPTRQACEEQHMSLAGGAAAGSRRSRPPSAPGDDDDDDVSSR